MIYAFGDIHGRYDLLVRALDAVSAHAGDRERTLIFLGDYIDRGPESRRVVEKLIDLEKSSGAICLLGNHEQLAVRAHYFDTWDGWLENGGQSTLDSYGGSIPDTHIEWMDRLRPFHTVGARHFVHAGVNPNAPEAPSLPDCIWIRSAFLSAPEIKFGQWHIVHGHSPVWEGKPVGSKPEILHHRTNLDTHAYKSGILAVGVFEGEQGGPSEVLMIGSDE